MKMAMKFEFTTLVAAVCAILSFSEYAIGEESYGIAFRVSENGLNALLQEPIRILFREATKPDSVELESVTATIPETGKILAKASAKGGATYEISTGLQRDATGGLKFANLSCKGSDQAGTSKDINGKITFHYPLLKDPEIVKGESGAASFAKFVVLGQSVATGKNTKPELNANIQDPEMDKTLADKDIVFEVTSLLLDSVVQALIDAEVTKDIPIDLSKLDPASISENPLGQERVKQLVDTVRHGYLATSCENSETPCLGKTFGDAFQNKYPNDSFAFKIDVTKIPAVKISPAGISAEISANVEFKLESNGAHLFNLLTDAGAQVSNASIKDGKIFLFSKVSKSPTFKIENDETGGLVKADYFSVMYNVLKTKLNGKLTELSTTGIEIPEIPFVNIENAEMITLENRLYFVVGKAAIQLLG